MDYIYDIILNFQDHYYEFYEWHKEDKIINIQKVPIYKITTKNYLTIKNNYVTIDTNSLFGNKKIVMLLLTDGLEVMGIFLNSQGKVLKKSSLIFEESDDILENINKLKITKIRYKLNQIDYNSKKSRISTEKEKYINNFFNNINKEKDKYKLKYIYYDIYGKEESNISKIYCDLINLSKTNKLLLYDKLKQIELEFSQKKASF